MSNSTILIADDDESLIRVLTVRCRNIGLEVVSAPDGTTALEKIQESIPSLMILDVNMPRGGAFHVCQVLARNEKLKQIPVIILTGDSEPAHMDQSLKFGAFYLPKSPYLWESLKPMLGRWFNITKAAW